MIVGLPHEDVKSIWRTHDIVKQHDDIDWWNWYALQIHNKERHEYHSPIDRDPKKYGYDVVEQPTLIRNNMVNDNIWITDWKNEHMNSKMAQMLSAKLRKMDAPLQKVAGWNCGSYSSLGLDVDKHYEDNDGLIQKMPIENMIQQKKKLVSEYIQTEIM